MNPLAATRGAVLAMLVLAGGPASAGDDCDAPPQSWQPRTAVRALAERNGWQVEHLKIDNGCYELKGRDAEGRRLKARIDPATLEVVELKRPRGGRAHDERPAGPPGSTPASGPRAG